MSIILEECQGKCSFGCMADDSFRLVAAIINNTQQTQHNCKKRANGYCSVCDCNLICSSCGHKGMMSYAKCKKDNCHTDVVFCPQCRRFVRIYMSTDADSKI